MKKRLSFKKNSPFQAADAGFSMVSVLVSTALLGIFTVMGSQGFKHVQTSARKVEASNSIRDIDNIAIQAITNRFKDYVLVDRCTTPRTTYFSNISIGSLGSVSLQPVRFHNKEGATVQAPEAAHNDLRRCTGTPFTRSTNTRNATTFYGCFNVNTPAAAANQAEAGSFAANRGAFIEFFVNIKDLRTDTLVTCNNLAGKGFGLEAYYYMHWAAQNTTETLYNSKIGSMNAAL